MRPLVLDDRQKAKAMAVVQFAQRNLYYPGKSETIPGDDPRHVLIIPLDYRCVFSITVSPEDKHYRHLSISVPKAQKYPHPVAAFMIADLFGFTGYDAHNPSESPPPDWLFDVNKEDLCVVLAQQLLG